MSLDLEKYYVEVDAKRKKPKKRDAEAAGAQSPPKRLSLPKRNTFKPPSFVAPPPRMDEDSDSDDESREGNRSFVLEERRRGIPQPWSGMDVSRFEEQPKRRRKAQQEDDEDDRGARRPQKRRYRDQDEEEGRFREDGDARARYPPRDRSRDSRSPGFRPARHPEESPGRYEPRGDHVLVREESETDYGRYTDERGDGRNAGRSSRGGRTPAAPPKREYYRNDERERYDDRYEDERYVEGGREQEYRERRWEREESPRRAYVNDRRPEPRYDEDQFAEDRYADGDGSDRDRTYEDERNVQNRGGRREVYPEEDHDYEENEQGRRGVLQDADDRDTREWQPHEQPDGEAPFEDAGPEHDRYHDRVEGPAETKSTHGSPRRKFVEDDDGRAKPEDEEEPRETSRAARPPRKTFEFKPIEHEPTVGSSDDEELPTVEQCLARKSTSNSVDKAPGVLERLLSDRKKALGIGTQVSESLTPSHPGYLRANRTSSKGVSSDGVQDPEAGHLPMTKENVPSPNLATGRLSQARSQAPAPSKPLVEASPDRPSPAPRVSMQAKSQQSRTLAPASDDIEDY